MSKRSLHPSMRPLDRAIEELQTVRLELRRRWLQCHAEPVRDLIVDSEHRICLALQLLIEEKQSQASRLRSVGGRSA